MPLRRFCIATALLGSLAFLFAVSAGSAPHEPTGTRIMLTPTHTTTQTFPAGQPFYLLHGWAPAPHEASPPAAVGQYTFMLSIDGAPVDPSYVERSTTVDDVTGPSLARFFVFNFPAGMSGTHTFVGTWYAPCSAWASCSGASPTKPFVAATATTTVTFGP
jgi:hypothetical protein